jgi:hypothetical protein
MDERRLETLQPLRRHIAQNHPDGSAKETFLLVLDQMILEAREISDRVAFVPDLDPESDTLDFLCECGAEDCVGTVKLTLTEYEELRQRGPILMDGHVPV